MVVDVLALLSFNLFIATMQAKRDSKLATISAYAVVVTMTLLSAVNADKRLVIFGDSLSDIGNILKKPTVIPYWMGRFSNGPVWNEYVAKWGDYTLINYAFGGAKSNNRLMPRVHQVTSPTPDILTQITRFSNTFGGKFSQYELRDDVAVVEIGSNDFRIAYKGVIRRKINPCTYAKSVGSSVGVAVSKLVDFGYSKIVVFNLPDLTSIPLMRMHSKTKKHAFTLFIEKINSYIKDEIDRILHRVRRIVDYIHLFDIFHFSHLSNDPQVHKVMGIENTYSACNAYNVSTNKIRRCEDSDKYLYIDTVHTNTKAHSLIGIGVHYWMKYSKIIATKDDLLESIYANELNKISSTKNILYNPDTYNTGITKVLTYNEATAPIHAEEIIAAGKTRTRK